jgi:hypothetical protein
MKKFYVSRENNFKNDIQKNHHATLANRMLLQCEFEEGKLAYVTYKNGHLIITVGNNIKRLHE